MLMHAIFLILALKIISRKYFLIDAKFKKGFFEVLVEFQAALRKIRLEKPNRRNAFNSETWKLICIFINSF